MIIEKVYNTRDNSNKLLLCSDEEPIDLSTYLRFVLKFEGSLIEADTDIDPTLITYDAFDAENIGVLTFTLGGLGMPSGTYFASLIAYNATSQGGDAFFHANNKTVAFKFIDPL